MRTRRVSGRGLHSHRRCLLSKREPKTPADHAPPNAPHTATLFRVRIGVFIWDQWFHSWYGIVSSFSSVLTTNTASSFAGSVLLAFSLTLCRSPGISEKLCPA